MPSRLISYLDKRLQPLCERFLDECNNDGVFKDSNASVFITCTYRSNDEQDNEYAKGRTSAGVPCYCGKRLNKSGSCDKHPFGLTVTKAKAGESPHNCVDKNGLPASRAFDFAVKKNESGILDWDSYDSLWVKAISIGIGLGLDSGSRFGDSPHMQLKDWKKI
jgi:hypothetical protein